MDDPIIDDNRLHPSTQGEGGEGGEGVGGSALSPLRQRGLPEFPGATGFTRARRSSPPRLSTADPSLRAGDVTVLAFS